MEDTTGDPGISAQPGQERRAGKRANEIQAFGSVIRTSIGLDHDVRSVSVTTLNHLVADSITLAHEHV
jgi:hypothetical protein